MAEAAIAWVDTETTGRALDDPTTLLLEVALVVTRARDLVELGRGSVVIAYSDKALDQYATWEPEALRMHQGNGLLAEIRRGCGMSTEEAEERLVDALVSALELTERELQTNEELRPYWGGCSTWFDRAALRERMPRIHGLIHHSPMDASSLYRALRLWGNEPRRDRAAAPHRALDDCLSAIEAARKIKAVIESTRRGLQPTLSPWRGEVLAMVSLAR